MLEEDQVGSSSAPDIQPQLLILHSLPSWRKADIKSSPVLSLTTFELRLEVNPLEAFIFNAMACSLRNLDLGGPDTQGSSESLFL